MRAAASARTPCRLNPKRRARQAPRVLQDARRPFEKRVRGPVKNVECGGFTSSTRAGLGRFCVWTHTTLRRRRLRTNGFGKCSHRGPPGTSRSPTRRRRSIFASHLLESDFAVSPQGRAGLPPRVGGAVCGAIPLGDWDASPAMAGRIRIAVVRLRTEGGDPAFYRRSRASSAPVDPRAEKRVCPGWRGSRTTSIPGAWSMCAVSRWRGTALSRKIRSQLDLRS